MLNVLLAVAGTSGDVNPFIGIGAALKERGHQVTLITNPHFERRAAAAGLRFIAVGTTADYDRATADPAMMNWRTGFDVVVREFIIPNIAPPYQRIAESYEPGRTVLVSNGVSFGARIAQEKLGIPMATVLVWPAALRSLHDPSRYGYVSMRWMGRWLKRLVYLNGDRFIDKRVGPPTNAFRAELGLPPARRFYQQWWASPQRIIGLFPDWYAPPPPDWPRQTVLTGFPLYDADPSVPAHDPTDYVDSSSPAPMLFTTGSANAYNEHFFAVAIQACRMLGRPGLLVTPHADQVPQNLPPAVKHVRDYVPFSKLFPGMAVVVHHGGIGTASLALAAGVPQVIMPMAHDHFDTAGRISKLGVGATLYRPFFRPKRLARVLRELMDSERVRERCEHLRARIDATESRRRTCELIEELEPDVLQYRER